MWLYRLIYHSYRLSSVVSIYIVCMIYLSLQCKIYLSVQSIFI